MRNCSELNNNTIVGFTTKEIYDWHLVESGLRESGRRRSESSTIHKTNKSYRIPHPWSSLDTSDCPQKVAQSGTILEIKLKVKTNSHTCCECHALQAGLASARLLFRCCFPVSISPHLLPNSWQNLVGKVIKSINDFSTLVHLFCFALWSTLKNCWARFLQIEIWFMFSRFKLFKCLKETLRNCRNSRYSI